MSATLYSVEYSIAHTQGPHQCDKNSSWLDQFSVPRPPQLTKFWRDRTEECVVERKTKLRRWLESKKIKNLAVRSLLLAAILEMMGGEIPYNSTFGVVDAL